MFFVCNAESMLATQCKDVKNCRLSCNASKQRVKKGIVLCMARKNL